MAGQIAYAAVLHCLQPGGRGPGNEAPFHVAVVRLQSYGAGICEGSEAT